jgi:hypothetical protein
LQKAAKASGFRREKSGKNKRGAKAKESIVKKIRRIRMTTTTIRLVVVQSKNAPPESGAHHPSEICPTCGQSLAASTEAPVLPAACPAEHEKDQS